MPLKEKDRKIIDMMANNEEAVSRLYSAYADRFPDYKGFWSELAVDEIEHATELRKLCELAESGGLFISEGRFNPVAIANFSKYLEKEAEPDRVKASSLINALSVAVYIEESIIERKFFEIFETDSARCKQILSDLADETAKHFEKTRQMWDEHKQPD